MTIEIAPALGDLPPLDGSAAEVTTFADNIIAASTSLEQYQSLADDQTVISGWQGEAAAAYKAYADQAADDAVPAATALKEVARAADVYASALTTLSSDRAAIVSSRSTYASDRQDLIADATGYDTEDSELVSRLESRAHDLQTSYNSLDQLP